MRRPSISGLAKPLAEAVARVCRAIRDAGDGSVEGSPPRGWLVGGAVRDLALGVTPHDADLASRLRPEELAPFFSTTVEVGRAFGTLVIVQDGHVLQHTTFRCDGTYSDARRPDDVRYGTTLEEDAARRDFTCNALYLDPLTDALRDPEGGLEDLGAGRLRAVGEPTERFAEDGLRLMRLARFAAGYGLEVDPHTFEGGRTASATLERVSAERVAAELARLEERPGTLAALQLLRDLGCLSGLASRFGWPRPEEALEELARLEGRPRFVELLALLSRRVESPGGRPEAARDVEARVRRLQLSKDATRRVVALLEDVGRARDLARAGWERAPAELLRVVRREEWPQVARLLRAIEPDGSWERFTSERERRSADELFPKPLVTSAELAAAGIPRGPRWGVLLRLAEDLQLEGRLQSARDARDWLEARAAESNA